MTTTATVSEWLSVVRRARLGRTVKGIAHALATRANNDGTSLFAGIARLSVECEVTPKVMKQALRTLREVGLIELVHASRTLGETNEYRLTLPPDGRLVVPSPAAHDLEIARVSASLRGKWKNLRGTGDPAGTDLRGSSDTAGIDGEPEPAGYGKDRRNEPAGYGKDDLRGTPYPATSPIPRQVTTTSPNTEELRTDLEVVDAPTSDQDRFFSEEPKPRLRLVPPSGQGFGFCMPCHAEGKTTLAADPVNGSACATHLRLVAS